MRKILFALCLFTSVTFLPGCGNLSPRQDHQKIENKDGKIGEVDNLANSLKAEIGNLKSQADIQNSKLDRIQQGLVNMQHTEDNSGVQILSGSGGLIVAIIGLLTVTIVMFHYRNAAKVQEKTANILAERVVHANDPALENAVFEAAMHTNVEENVLNLIKKHKSLL